MRQIIKYIVIVFFAVLWFLGCSKDASKYLFDKKILKDDYRYGDLYRLSNLRKFREPVDVCEQKEITDKKPIHLFIAGDSFTEEGRISNENFVSNAYTRGFVAQPNQALELDKQTQNVLIVETVERHLRERFAQPWRGWDTLHVPTVDVPLVDEVMNYDMPYNAELEEAIFFGSDFMLFFKEIKAWINLNVFNKTDEKVRLSADGQHLLYYLDIDPGISSGFVPVSDGEIDTLVKHANQTYAYYKSLGFDEVYLSVIPNKSSILGRDLGVYNDLIKRVENHPNLQFPIISIISEFEKGGASVYDVGDTHWNCKGKYIWLDKVNGLLRNLK